MPIERRLFGELRRLDQHDLRRVLIFVRGLLHAMDDPAGRGDEHQSQDEGGAVTYRLESVQCGKSGCKTCPHGPYWYAYYRENGRLKSRYIGRELPEGVEPTVSSDSGD